MRSVLITGTSSGIGLATAVVLASRGWRVFATMRNLKEESALEQALRAAGMQDNVDIQELDVTRFEVRFRLRPLRSWLALGTHSMPSYTMPAWLQPVLWRMYRSPSFGG